MTDSQRSNVGTTRGSSEVKRKPKAKPVDVARKAIGDGAEAVRQQATAAYEAGAHAVDNAPLTALAGAIAVGAVAAALIPNSARELQALGPLGDRVRGAVDGAFSAAKEAGAEQLTARGLTAAATSTGAGALLGSIVKAVLAANGAAKEALHPTEGVQEKSPAA
ncbi:hypothetical protein [Sphingomonas sp.]|uniref:hypothetical protein n=1 Tax=Sphingomonas sp. TaxID=28214 RepID=UPI0025E26FEC|nr:hypothetical protein [Sphingomonas sp.]